MAHQIVAATVGALTQITLPPLLDMGGPELPLLTGAIKMVVVRHRCTSFSSRRMLPQPAHPVKMGFIGRLRFYGTSQNAVKTQIWVAISTYVLVAIMKKRLQIDLTLYTILQILSITLFEKMPILVIQSNEVMFFQFASSSNGEFPPTISR